MPMSAESLNSLLTAMTSADKPAFLARCDEVFAKVAEEQFDRIAQNLGPNLKSGYSLTSMGALQRKVGEISVFKITFKNGADEKVALISEKDGKVAGLVLK